MDEIEDAAPLPESEADAAEDFQDVEADIGDLVALLEQADESAIDEAVDEAIASIKNLYDQADRMEKNAKKRVDAVRNKAKWREARLTPALRRIAEDRHKRHPKQKTFYYLNGQLALRTKPSGVKFIEDNERLAQWALSSCPESVTVELKIGRTGQTASVYEDLKHYAESTIGGEVSITTKADRNILKRGVVPKESESGLKIPVYEPTGEAIPDIASFVPEEETFEIK
jgi:hypothetical protein